MQRLAPDARDRGFRREVGEIRAHEAVRIIRNLVQVDVLRVLLVLTHDVENLTPPIPARDLPGDIVKDVRGSESTCEHDSRNM